MRTRLSALLYERDRRQQLGSASPRRPLEVQPVDHINDLHMPWQQAVEQFHRPRLQRLRQQRMIGVTQRALGDAPGIVPSNIMLVDQDAHELGDGDCRVCVVELDGDVFRQ